jgi:hypothetical protein
LANGKKCISSSGTNPSDAGSDLFKIRNELMLIETNGRMGVYREVIVPEFTEFPATLG